MKKIYLLSIVFLSLNVAGYYELTPTPKFVRKTCIYTHINTVNGTQRQFDKTIEIKESHKISKDCSSPNEELLNASDNHNHQVILKVSETHPLYIPGMVIYALEQLHDPSCIIKVEKIIKIEKDSYGFG